MVIEDLGLRGFSSKRELGELGLESGEDVLQLRESVFAVGDQKIELVGRSGDKTHTSFPYPSDH